MEMGHQMPWFPFYPKAGDFDQLNVTGNWTTRKVRPLFLKVLADGKEHHAFECMRAVGYDVCDLALQILGKLAKAGKVEQRGTESIGQTGWPHTRDRIGQ